jgi:CDP-diacylglycerol--glycerol-3-phosphate 3-phosphatidyltransferase
MNLPNKLSMLRILAVPPFIALMLGDQWVGVDHALVRGTMKAAALVLLIAVAITDWLDGKIARERRLISNLGKLLDPLADKVFVTAALVCLVELRLVPGWAVILIIAREFVITGLRTLAADCGRVIAADRLGKHKTGWQFALLIGSTLALAVRDFCLYGGVWGTSPLLGDPIITGIVWITLSVTLVLTVMSGWSYVVQNRDLLET